MGDSIRLLAAVAAGILVAAMPHVLAAQEWPSKPVRIITPFPPGGVTDGIARNIQEPLSRALGQPVVVENKSGAAGAIGTEAIVRSPPDGYTFGVVISSHAANAALRNDLPFDPERDITPITRFGVNKLLLLVHPSLGVRDFAGLLDLGKKKQIHYASAGIGSAQHFAGATLKIMTGMDLVHVPYRGGGPAVADLLAGRVGMLFASLGLKQHADSGALIGLAVSHEERSRLAPTLPTVAESGVPGFGVFEWYALIGPANIPAPILDRLNRELRRIGDDPALEERWSQQGMEMVTSTPEETRTWLAGEVARYKELVPRISIEKE